MLVLPAETPDSRGAVRFQHRHFENRPAQCRRLRIADCDDRVVRNGLDVAVAQRIRRHPERAHVVFEVHTLDELWISGARLNQRAARRFEELVAVQMSGAVLGDLARAARRHVLVTLGATLRVVGRSESVGYRLDFFEDEPVVVERAPRHHGVFVEFVERRTLHEVTVGHVVESGQRFGRTRSRRRWTSDARCTVGVPSGFAAGSSDGGVPTARKRSRRSAEASEMQKAITSKPAKAAR